FYNLSQGEQPERLGGIRVSSSLFPILGIQPAIGRAFRPEEDLYNGPRVASLRDGLWKRRFGADPQLIGKQSRLNGESYRVIGVMPHDFQFAKRNELPSDLRFFPAQSDLWTPLTLTPEEAADRGTRNLAVIGRLKPNVSRTQAQADMNALAGRLAER